MKLMTKTLEKSLNKKSDKVKAHYFNPLGRGDWYVLKGKKQENGDWLFYGYVKSPIDPLFDEYGYFTLNELESVKLPFGLGIERDLYWTECPVQEVI